MTRTLIWYQMCFLDVRNRGGTNGTRQGNQTHPNGVVSGIGPGQSHRKPDRNETAPCRTFCLNGGTCQDTKCICPPGFSGEHCSERKFRNRSFCLELIFHFNSSPEARSQPPGVIVHPIAAISILIAPLLPFQQFVGSRVWTVADASDMTGAPALMATPADDAKLVTKIFLKIEKRIWFLLGTWSVVDPELIGTCQN